MIVLLAATAALTAGLAGAVQIAAAGALGREVGVFEASAFASVIAAVVLWGVLLIARGGVGAIGSAFAVPAWMWLGGLMSAALVICVTIAMPRIGAVATMGLLMVGQMGLGTAIDSLGWLGADRIALTPMRVAGIALVAIGTLLLLRGR